MWSLKARKVNQPIDQLIRIKKERVFLKYLEKNSKDDIYQIWAYNIFFNMIHHLESLLLKSQFLEITYHSVSTRIFQKQVFCSLLKIRFAVLLYLYNFMTCVPYKNFYTKTVKSISLLVDYFMYILSYKMNA